MSVRRATSVPCEWRSEEGAVRDFVQFRGKTQSQGHIKPLHWYIACRLVLEGGFLPQDITPRPPFRVETKKKKLYLVHDPSVATGVERVILGGLKTKLVDVVVCKDGVGPVLAVSCKGMTGALRNLTNRMEETVGECTNLHITYPALAFGYFFVIRANQNEVVETPPISMDDAKKVIAKADVAIGRDESPVAALERFHYALTQMEGRRGVRNDLSRYEAVALAVANERGALLESFPRYDSRVRLNAFFSTLYDRYDERFVFTGAALRAVTARKFWFAESPAFTDVASMGGIGYLPRLAVQGGAV